MNRDKEYQLLRKIVNYNLAQYFNKSYFSFPDSEIFVDFQSIWVFIYKMSYSLPPIEIHLFYNLCITAKPALRYPFTNFAGSFLAWVFWLTTLSVHASDSTWKDLAALETGSSKVPPAGSIGKPYVHLHKSRASWLAQNKSQ